MEFYGYRARKHGGEWFYYTAATDAEAIATAEQRTGESRDNLDVWQWDSDFHFWMEVNS